jgi:hypothetical protein
MVLLGPIITRNPAPCQPLRVIGWCPRRPRALAGRPSALFQGWRSRARRAPHRLARRAGRQRHRDIDGLAGPGAVVDDPALAAVQLDQAIQQLQAPAALGAGGWVLPDRAAGAPVMDLDPQITAVVGQPYSDRPSAVAQRVRDQFTDDELDKTDMAAETPAGQRVAGLLTSMAACTGSWPVRQATENSRMAVNGIHGSWPRAGNLCSGVHELLARAGAQARWQPLPCARRSSSSAKEAHACPIPRATSITRTVL